jgi:4-oxalocrotonate tautomerase
MPPRVIVVRLDEIPFVNLGTKSETLWESSAKSGVTAYGGPPDPRIDIQIVEGRPLEAKRESAKRIAEKCAEILKIPKEDIRIVFDERKKENFSQGGILNSDRKDIP